MRAKLISGFFALSARQMVSNAVALAKLGLIVTLLPIAEYGVYVISNGLVNYLLALCGIGIGAYLIRAHGDPSPELVGTARALVLLIGGAGLLVAVLAAPWLADWYGQPEIAPLIAVQALALPLTLLCSIPAGLLDRALSFTRSARIGFGAEMCGFVVTVAVMWTTRSPWGLVWGHLVQCAIHLALLSRATPTWRSLAWDRAEAGRILRFGLALGSAGWLHRLGSLVNPVLVAKLLGPESAAVVAIGVRALELIGFIQSIFSRIMFGGLAALNAQSRSIETVLASAQAAQFIALGGVLSLLVAGAPELVGLLPGQQWSGVRDLLPLLCAAALVGSTFSLHLGALQVRSEPRPSILANALFSALFLASAAVLLSLWPDLRAYGLANLIATAGFLACAPLIRSRLPHADLGAGGVNLLMWLALVGLAWSLWPQPVWVRGLVVVGLWGVLSVALQSNRDAWRFLRAATLGGR